MSTNTPLIHRETWTFAIERDGDDDWPDCPVPYSKVGALFRPEKVHVELDRGAREPHLTVTGWRLKGGAHGTPGRQAVTVRWYDIDRLITPVVWLVDGVTYWRKVLGLGPDETGVPWGPELA